MTLVSYSNVKNNDILSCLKYLKKWGHPSFCDMYVGQKLEYSRRVYEFSDEIQDGRHINPMGHFPAMGTT